MEEQSREAAKRRALLDSDYASRDCPHCGYPCSDYLRRCGVCGFEIGRVEPL